MEQPQGQQITISEAAGMVNYLKARLNDEIAAQALLSARLDEAVRANQSLAAELESLKTEDEEEQAA